MFNKVLVAKKGEVACHVIRTRPALGIKSVAVSSLAEGTPMHVRLADEPPRPPEHETPAAAYLHANNAMLNHPDLISGPYTTGLFRKAG